MVIGYMADNDVFKTLDGRIPTFDGQPVSKGFIEHLKQCCCGMREAEMIQRAYMGREINHSYDAVQEAKKREEHYQRYVAEHYTNLKERKESDRA